MSVPAKITWREVLLVTGITCTCFFATLRLESISVGMFSYKFSETANLVLVLPDNDLTIGSYLARKNVLRFLGVIMNNRKRNDSEIFQSISGSNGPLTYLSGVLSWPKMFVHSHFNRLEQACAFLE